MKRIHITPDNLTIEEASLFIVSSLLVSHGIRREAEAWVKVGDSWVVARGSKIRQLRPDPVSAEAWLRAVVYRGKTERLGAEVLKDIEPPPGLCVSGEGEVPVEEVIGSDLRSGRDVVLWYGKGCREASLGIPILRVWMMPALTNILVDRVMAGLQP